MKVTRWIFLALGIFYIPVGTVYGFMTKWHEPLGFLGLYVTSLMTLFLAFYLSYTLRHIDEQPEDDLHGEVAQGAGELGFFSPYSWWPFAVALALACMFAGLAAGWWLFFIGVPLVGVGVVGWVFEYYRGEFAH